MGEVYNEPIVEHKIKVNGASREMFSTTTVSLNEGFNKVNVQYKCTNQSLSLFQIWVTKEGEDWGLGIGKLAFQNQGGIKSNTWYDANITLTSELFPEGDTTYRLTLCSRGDIDGTWNITYILFTLNGEIFKPTDADAVELIVNDEQIPDNFNDPLVTGSVIKLDSIYVEQNGAYLDSEGNLFIDQNK